MEAYCKNNGDIRKEFPPNDDDCTSLNGQIIAFFDSPDPAKREVIGTARIIYKHSERKFVIITAAHNLV